MRNREILLLGGGLTGAFFLALGMLTIDAPVRTVAPVPSSQQFAAAPAAGVEFGWIPAELPSQEGASVVQANPASVPGGAPPGQAGVWSIPAEFADPE
ncbi:MAG TPA: hypothetical protein VFO69_00035 [Allosphingosinicella sp.]|nr:hypothetical protein [Allosphingosinicella sp.]